MASSSDAVVRVATVRRWGKVTKTRRSSRNGSCQHQIVLPCCKPVKFFGHDGLVIKQLKLSGADVFLSDDNDGEVGWTRLSREFLDQRWMYMYDRWFVARPASGQSIAVYTLAMTGLEYWENHIHPNYSKRARKQWSHLGVTRQGDCGNRVYYVVMKLCLRIREVFGGQRLSILEAMGCQAAGDVLEGIMGLARLTPGTMWDYYAQAVADISVATMNLWKSPRFVNEWSDTTLVQQFPSELKLDCLDEHFAFEEFRQAQDLRISVAVALQKRLARPVVGHIYSFLKASSPIRQMFAQKLAHLSTSN